MATVAGAPLEREWRLWFATALAVLAAVFLALTLVDGLGPDASSPTQEQLVNSETNGHDT